MKMKMMKMRMRMRMRTESMNGASASIESIEEARREKTDTEMIN